MGDFSRRDRGKLHLDFKQTKDTGKTKVWDVVSTHTFEIIGEIKWWGAWRKYVFFPQEGTLYDVSCMNHICDFISEQMESRKKSVTKKTQTEKVVK